MRRRGLALAGAVLTAGVLAPAAHADHHEIKIREVFPGSPSLPNAEYVELQMYSSGQNFFMDSNATVTLYSATGTENLGVLLDQDMSNGANQSRVLVGVENLETMGFSPDADPDFEFAAGDRLSNAGGAACFNAPAFSLADCVSWGNFIGSLPSPPGGNTPAINDGGGIGDPQAIRRSITRRCNTLLEASDDTNSPSDWAEVSPDPFNNAAPPGGATCPNTTITKRPSNRTTDRTPRFKFKSSKPSSTFRCRIDSKPYRSCDSPHTTKRLGFRRHKFRVKATSGGSTDPTPAVDRFRVIRD